MAYDPEVVERVARAIRRKAAEIDHRPGVHTPDAMWFADEIAIAALDAAQPEIEARLAEADAVIEAYTRGMRGAPMAKTLQILEWRDQAISRHEARRG